MIGIPRNKPVGTVWSAPYLLALAFGVSGTYLFTSWVFRAGPIELKDLPGYLDLLQALEVAQMVVILLLLAEIAWAWRRRVALRWQKLILNLGSAFSIFHVGMLLDLQRFTLESVLEMSPLG